MLVFTRAPRGRFGVMIREQVRTSDSGLRWPAAYAGKSCVMGSPPWASAALRRSQFER